MFLRTLHYIDVIHIEVPTSNMKEFTITLHAWMPSVSVQFLMALQ